MISTQTEWQGTWEEIKAHDAELTGHTVRVTILDHLDALGKTSDLSGLSPIERFATVNRIAEEMEREMPYTQSGDTVAIIREGRAGAM